MSTSTAKNTKQTNGGRGGPIMRPKTTTTTTTTTEKPKRRQQSTTERAKIVDGENLRTISRLV